MPITASMVVAGKGNRANKSASLFDSGQTAPINTDAPPAVPSGSPTHSAVVSDPGSTGTIDNQVGNDAPGAVPTSQLHTSASGSGSARESSAPIVGTDPD
jgi:hypothetical protein